MAMGGAMDSCGRCMKMSLVAINILTFRTDVLPSWRLSWNATVLSLHWLPIPSNRNTARLLHGRNRIAGVLPQMDLHKVLPLQMFIFQLGGALALAIGVWIWVSRSFPSTLMSNNMFIASVAVVVAMGAAVMILSLLGCCGAAKEVKCMLLTYYILVFIIFVVMLVGGILLFVFREKVLTTLEREMHASIPNYGVRHEYTHAWDQTQTYLQCCGVKSYKDWNDNVPESCCQEVYPGKRQDCKYNQNPTTMYMDGCYSKTVELLREDAVYVGAVAIAVALIMVLALIFSCGLFVKIE